MENPKNQIAERIKEANNVLVTVSANPSVDQLAAAIGLTLVLNKLGKHGTAVFSGKVPSTIQFLKPEETLEKNTDSLRDFIIALDKSKADKLRYKVEDKMVKIFITPYRTSIDEQDLEFSQGDFNVEVVVGLGVRAREDLDQAITTHGRILHDATVTSINTGDPSNLGTINWADNEASSLSEMVVALSDLLKTGMMDGQIATALLTGIVAETDRFSNSKTTSNTMNASAKLMAAGANQQLIATKLQEPEQPGSEDKSSTDGPSPDGGNDQDNGDGSLQIDHDELPEPQVEEIHIDEHGNLGTPEPEDKTAEPKDKLPEPEEKPQVETENRRMLVEPPVTKEGSALPGYEGSPSEPDDNHLVMDPPLLGGQLTANTKPENLDPSTDPLSTQLKGKILSHDAPPATNDKTPAEEANNEQPVTPPPSPPEPSPPPDNSQPSLVDDPGQTLIQIEESVDSPHVDQASEPPQAPPVDSSSSGAPPNLNSARDAVQSVVAQASNSGPLEPIMALNAQPVNLDLGHGDAIDSTPSTMSPDAPPVTQDIQIDPLSGELQLPGQPLPPTPPPSSVPDLPPLPPMQPLQPSPLDSNGLPTNLVPPMPGLPPDPTAPSVTNPTAPPPVPPPMMPPMPPIQ